jgi:two-component system, OmpR family, response regulator ChvI
MERRKIMVVDDEKDITQLMKLGLEHRGFSVDTFSDPFQAISSFRTAPTAYGFILLDVRMPDLNGFEVYRRLKEIDSSIKIGFLTGIEMREEEFTRLFPQMRIECFLRKPMRVSELADHMGRMMDEKHGLVETDGPTRTSAREKETRKTGGKRRDGETKESSEAPTEAAVRIR